MLGIGGIGMSAMARYFCWEGRSTAGYDRTLTTLTHQLEAEGCRITDREAVAAIPPDFTDPQHTLVVYTPAIPSDHPQLRFFQQGGFRVVKRSDVLGWLSRKYPTLGVAGTHGKTSTAGWLTFLLDRLHVPILSLVGGILNNYGRNVVLPPPDTPPRFFVVEADEYDRTFLKIDHTWAVVNAIDPDHLDIYHTEAAFLAAFRQFVAASREGVVLADHVAAAFREEKAPPKKVVFGRDASADYAFTLPAVDRVQLYRQGRPWFETPLPVPGVHNAYNLTAALALIDRLVPEVNVEDLQAVIPQYRGVWRRFSRIEGVPFVWIDDYAHLPAEIETTLRTMQALYPDRRVVAVFHPHLYSRTRDFASAFAGALTLADEVWLLPIYPAREQPIPGVSSASIAQHFPPDFPHELISKEELFRRLTTAPPPVLITLGAGDVDQMIPEVVRHYSA